MPRLCLASGFLVNSIGALSQKECDLLLKQLRGQWKEGIRVWGSGLWVCWGRSFLLLQADMWDERRSFKGQGVEGLE